MIALKANYSVEPIENHATIFPDIGWVDRIRVTRGVYVPQGGRMMPAIKAAASLVFDVSLTDLEGARRSRGVVWPRHAAIYVAKSVTGLSLPQIGRAFGGRDHTTVLHAIRCVGDRMAKYPDYKAKVEKVMEMVGA